MSKRVQIRDHSPKNTIVKISQTKDDYDLNIDKLMKKKLQATKRPQHISYELSNGNVVFTADAVSFELTIIALAQLYKKYPIENGTVNLNETFDVSGDNLTRQVYRISKTDGSSYTLNVYPTTCRLMLNGKNAKTFLETDMPQVHKIVEYWCEVNSIDLKTFNELLAQSLSDFLAKQETSDSVSSTRSNSSLKPVSDSATEKDNETCIGCKRRCKTKSVYCTKGSHWIHYKCDKLKPHEIEEIEKNEKQAQDYTCMNCSNITIKTVKTQVSLPNIATSSSTSAETILIEETDLEITKLKTVHSAQVLSSSNEVSVLSNSPTDVFITGPCSCNIKLSEIRERETKARKKEEEVKEREKKSLEKNKETSKLESYIKKLEARNQELQNTLQTFTRRIEMLEIDRNNHAVKEDVPCVKNVSVTGGLLNNRILAVQEKLTNFVMDKIELEFDKLISAPQNKTENSSNGGTHVFSSNSMMTSESTDCYSDIDIHQQQYSTQVHQATPVSTSATYSSNNDVPDFSTAYAQNLEGTVSSGSYTTPNVHSSVHIPVHTTMRPDLPEPSVGNPFMGQPLQYAALNSAQNTPTVQQPYFRQAVHPTPHR